MNPQQSNVANSNSPSVVDNIPIHNQVGMPDSHQHDDADLDKIMQDVGHELKKDDKKPAKRNLFGRNKKAKAEAKFSAQPQPVMEVHTQPLQQPAPAPPVPASQTHSVPQTQPIKAPHGVQKNVVKAKPPKQSSKKPVLAILVTVAVTGGLIAAAISAYK